MKPKILAKLVIKFPGLSKQLLGLVADKLVAKVTEESEIDAAITDLDNQLIPIPEYAKLLQTEGDKRVTEATKKAAAEKAAAEHETEEDDDPDKPAHKPKSKGKGGDDPIAKLTAMVQGLTTEITNLKQSGQQQSFSEKLNKELAVKKIPLEIAKNRTLKEGEDFETVLAEIEADHIAIKQQIVNDGLVGAKFPVIGSGAPADATAVKANIDAWAKANAPAAKNDSKTT